MTVVETIRAFLEAEARFVVVGGVAATAHGSARVTLDLDLCYETSLENREAIARVLKGWHAYPREVEPGLPFAMDARTLGDLEVLNLSTDAGPIDLLQRVPGVGDYAACVKASEDVTVDGLRFTVLSLPALIASKKAAGRPRDLEALFELEALEELRSGE